jgi:hypothetical protein
MSFTPFQFFRNPPATVPSPAPEPSEFVSSGSGGTSAISTSSRATTLASSLSDLAGTSAYLQSVILSITKGLGVTVNVATNPDLGRALAAIYGTIPPAVSITMYSNLLDTEFGAQQVTQAAGPTSTVQANPLQVQSVVTVNKAVETALSAQGDFQSQLPLMLRSLKTQATALTAIQAQLSSYPAATSAVATTNDPTVVQASSVDVGDDVNDALTDFTNSLGSVYAAVFSMMAGISSISQDISCMVKTFATLQTGELAQIKSLFTMVSQTSVSEDMQDISNGLTSFVFVQLMSDASGMLFTLDRVAQMALAPLKTMMNPLGSALTSVQGNAASNLVGVVRQVTSDARVSTGVLQGMIASNTTAAACGSQAKPPAPPAASAVPPSTCSAEGPNGSLNLSSGMNELSTLLDWSLSKANAKVQSSLNSMKKLMTKTQTDTCNQVKLLTMVNNLGTLSSLATSFLQQQNSSSTTASTATSLLATVGSILSSTQTGNGVSYTVQNGSIVVTPPAVPVPTAAATAVLSKAGVQTSLSGISQSL